MGILAMRTSSVRKTGAAHLAAAPSRNGLTRLPDSGRVQVPAAFAMGCPDEASSCLVGPCSHLALLISLVMHAYCAWAQMLPRADYLYENSGCEAARGPLHGFRGALARVTNWGA